MLYIYTYMYICIYMPLGETSVKNECYLFLS